MSEDLNPKQAAFVKEYLVDRNGTQAAIRAGYSAKTANVKGAQLLAIVSIKQAVEAGEAEHAARCDVTVDTIKQMMDEDRVLANQLGQVGPAVTTTMNMAKLFGLITDKAQVHGDMSLNVFHGIPDADDPD